MKGEAISTLKEAAKPIWSQVSNSTRDTIIVLGGIIVVAAIVFCWAAFFRKRPRQSSSWHTHHSSGGGHHNHHHHKRRRRRHQELPRNPTLAETGGLPARRSDDADAAGQKPDHS